MRQYFDTVERPTRWRSAAIAVGALVLALAAAAVTASVVDRAEARFSGTTANEGSLFASATVDITLGASDGSEDAADAVALTLDSVNMVPGDGLERCLEVTYHGSLDDVEVRLFGERDGPPGLDLHLNSRVEVGSGSDPNCGDFDADHTVDEGSLAELWQRHGSFADGLELMRGADDGDTATVRIEIELLDHDDAQGLDLWFWFVIEARP